ncbi:MAG TPA: tetratricopeptide repeat protein, partial [Candidatus Eisenbacteria bacterium]
TFLTWILMPYLVLSILFNRELGGARDWDLVATLAVPSILLVGLTFAAAPGPAGGDSRRERRTPVTGGASPALAVTLLGASLFHLVGFVLVDTDHARSRRHFLALFDEGAPVSRFARSYALEEVGRDDIEHDRYDEAIQHFEEAVRVDPANMKAIGTLGSLYNSRGDAARALPHLERAVRLRPDIGLNHYNLGAALSTAGRPGDAALSFNQALEIDETIEPAWVGLANMALALQMVAQADSVASEGLRRFPTNADLLVAAAVAREQLGRPAEAINLFDAALRAAPDNRSALFNLGRLHNSQGQFALTIPILERLTALEPHDAEAWNNLGVARLQLGRLDEAGRAFMSALSAAPDLVPAVGNFAQVLVRQGRREEAMGVLQSFLDRRPDLARPAGIDRMLDAVRRGAGATGAP